jgi:hypothetical protein
MESAANRLQELPRQADAQFKIVSEANERIISSVAALDAENRVVCQERIQKLEDDLARAADRSTEQFRDGLNSLLSSLVGTVGSGRGNQSTSICNSLNLSEQSIRVSRRTMDGRETSLRLPGVPCD